MKKLFIFMLFISMISIVSAVPQNWTIQNNKVFINDSNVYISAEPHTVWNQDVTIGLISKHYSGNINLLIGFNSNEAIPKLPRYYNPVQILDTNGTYYTQYWHTLNKDITVINKNFDNKNKWYLLQNININAGDINKLKFYLETFNTTKYDVIFYPSSYGNNINTAYNDNNLYILDPWTGAPPTSGDVYYDFEEGSGTTATDLWGSNDGTLVNGVLYSSDVPTFGSDGDGGSYSVSFDGTDDYINAGNVLNDNFQEVSISLWFKPKTVDYSPSSYSYLLGNRNPSSPYNGIYCLHYTYSNPKNFICSMRGDSTTATVESTTIPSINTWYHIVATFKDDDKLSLYINGELEDTDTTDAGSIWDVDVLHLGNKNLGGTGNSYIQGLMDEVKIYNKVLSPTEVSNLYNCGIASSCDQSQPINIITKYYNGTESNSFNKFEYINFTVNNTQQRQCNITLYNNPIEDTLISNSFTLCNSGCDYSDYTYNYNDTGLSVNSWGIENNICHENPTTSISYTLSCTGESQEITIPSNEIPDCDTNKIKKEINFNVCKNNNDINISIISSGTTYSKRGEIYNLTIRELYTNATYNLTLSGNNSYLNENFNYNETGLKNIFVICEDNTTTSSNITINSETPILIKDRLDTDCYTIYYNPSYEGSTFEYCSSNYIFNDIVQSSTPIQWEYNIYCNGNLVSYDNGTSLSIIQNITEINVTDFNGSNILSCYKNISIINDINISDISYFNINDTVNPICTGLINSTTDTSGNLELSGQCTDQNFNSININCNGTSILYNTSLSTELFNFDIPLSLSSDTICNYSYCDGHPTDYNCVDGNFTILYYMIEESFQTLTCPAESTGISILFSTMCIIAFLMLILGIIINKGLFTLISGILFIILSLSLYGCSVMLGNVFVVLGIILVTIGFFRQEFF